MLFLLGCWGGGPACPEGMAGVTRERGLAWCIDRYEASHRGTLGGKDQRRRGGDGSTAGVALSVAGARPTTAVSWYQAAALCRNAGKHLCTVTEWQDSCDGKLGPGGATYPWGEAPDPSAVCAAPSPGHNVGAPMMLLTGASPRCTGALGVYDLIGNAWEWADPEEDRLDGVPMTAKLGAGFYAGRDRASCTARPDRGHLPSFDGTISFRCCASPAEVEALLSPSR